MRGRRISKWKVIRMSLRRGQRMRRWKLYQTETSYDELLSVNYILLEMDGRMDLMKWSGKQPGKNCSKETGKFISSINRRRFCSTHDITSVPLLINQHEQLSNNIHVRDGRQNLPHNFWPYVSHWMASRFFSIYRNWP